MNSLEERCRQMLKGMELIRYGGMELGEQDPDFLGSGDLAGMANMMRDAEMWIMHPDTDMTPAQKSERRRQWGVTSE